MASDTQKGTALALLASAQWGATGIWVALLRDLPTGTTLVFRFLTAALLLTVLLTLTRGFQRPNQRTLYGGVLLAAYYVLATVGFYLSDVVSVSLLVSTSPFFVMLLRVLRRQPVAGREVLIGCVLGLLVSVRFASPAAAAGPISPALFSPSVIRIRIRRGAVLLTRWAVPTAIPRPMAVPSPKASSCRRSSPSRSAA
mgnify:CR=1 FL=1